MNIQRALLLLLTLAGSSFPLSAQSPVTPAAPAIRDGSHDFDFHIGTWRTRVRRRVAPLTGSNEWVEMNGTTTVRKVWNGLANLVELEASGLKDAAKGPFRGLSLRLYHPEAGQWSLHYANAADGELALAAVGQFHGELHGQVQDVRGEFYNQETLRGRAILVRFVISGITPSAVHFEQAYSDDGGRTWEVNWIADDTRIAEGAGSVAQTGNAAQAASAAQAGNDTPGFRLTSSSFAAGGTLSDRTVLDGLDCHGANASPALQWSGAPAGTKSFALILDDYEARYGDGFIHWVAYGIPATTASLAQNAGAAEGDLAGGGRHAYNDFLRRRYDGPCPPEGPAHRYRFTLFALDLPVVDNAGKPGIDDAGTPMTWRKLRAVIKGHILGQTSLTGLRGH